MNRRRNVLICVLVVVTIILLLSTTFASDDPFAGIQTHEEGYYIAGTDNTAGKNVLLKESDLSACFIIYSNANRQSITSNRVFEINSIITVDDGEYLQLKRCIAIESTVFYSSCTTKTACERTTPKGGIQRHNYTLEQKLLRTDVQLSIKDERRINI